MMSKVHHISLPVTSEQTFISVARFREWHLNVFSLLSAAPNKDGLVVEALVENGPADKKGGIYKGKS